MSNSVYGHEDVVLLLYMLTISNHLEKALSLSLDILETEIVGSVYHKFGV
jgi:hypothetical protein